MERFIELNRGFEALTGDEPEDAATRRSYALAFDGVSGYRSWDDLLKHWLVVVLGEPGSGKSTELEALHSRRDDSFLLGLDRLVRESVTALLPDSDMERFRRWKSDDSEMLFLLDAVDESKLNRDADFATAIVKLSKEIGPSLSRARFAVTSRVSEWRVQTDLDIVTQNLVPESSSRTVENARNGDAAESQSVRTKEKKSSEPKALVVTLRPLTPGQVRTYVEGRGAPDAAEFLDALQNSNSVAFAGRPIDVTHLYDYWQTYRHLGSLTGVVEFVVTKLLAEVSDKEKRDPLSPDVAREGAEYLAAAATLCKNLRFSIPDDGRFADSVHLSPQAILPEDWVPSLRRALMDRALFDSPSRGALSFHHRLHIEYLTARWLERLMANNCSFDDLMDLLCAEVDGSLSIRQSLAPVAAWLVTEGNEPWRLLLAAFILEVAPEIHFQHGDPGALPLPYRRQVLRAIIDKYGDRQYVGMRVNPDALSRIADVQLAEDINGYLSNEDVSDGLKTDLLMVIWEGGLTGCIDTALDLFSRPATSEFLRSYCLEAVRLVGTPEHQLELARRAGGVTELSDKAIGHIFEALYPAHMRVDESLTFLRRATTVPKYNHELQNLVTRHLAGAQRPDDAIEFLRGFVDMVQEPPLTERRAVSQSYHWVIPLVPICLSVVLEKTTDRAIGSDTILDALVLVDGWLTNGAYESVGTVDYVQKARQLLKNEHSIRQLLLWRRFDALDGPVRLESFPFYRLSPFNGLAPLDVGDIDWLLADIEQRDEVTSRLVAMTLLLRVFKENRISKIPLAWKLRRALAVPELRSVFVKHLWGSLRIPIVSRWVTQYHVTYSHRWWWGAKLRKISGVVKLARSRVWLWTHLSDLSAGTYPIALSQLTTGMIDDGGNRFGVANWDVVAAKWGKTVASRTAQGCVNAWPQFVPQFPHESANRNSTDRRVIVGLIGLQTLWKDGKLDFTAFSAQDVERAIRYACNELNGLPEWFFTLASERRTEVEQALSVPIAAEFAYPGEWEHVHDVVAKLGAAPIPTEAVNSALLAVLNAADPANAIVLEQAFSALRRGGDVVIASLRRVAPTRVAMRGVQQRFWNIWMATWMEVDAIPAMTYLQATLNDESAENADDAMEGLCARLRGRPHISQGLASPSYQTPESLAILIPLVYAHVRPANDIDRLHGGVYSPTARDHAQDFRDRLWEALRSEESRDADDVLRSFLDDGRLAERRDWVLSILDERQGKLADQEAWQPDDVRTFAKIFRHEPRSDYQMFSLVSRILRNFKLEVENSESATNRRLVREGDREWQFQGVLEHRLIERSLGWFSVTKESEVDLGQRPDLRVERPGLNALPIEVKLANLEHWTIASLLERLENQLVGQYLRSAGVAFGIYFVGTTSPNRRWQSADGRRIYFEELVTILQARAAELVASRMHKAQGLEVIGIDFSDPRERVRPRTGS